jgi:hypothetical protein
MKTTLFIFAILLAILGCSIAGVEVIAASLSLFTFLMPAAVVLFGCVIAGYLISEAFRPQMEGCYA